MQVYSQVYNTSVPAIGGATALNYTSPVLHNVRLTGLTPNTQYFYQAGDGTNFSPVFNFTSMQTAGGVPLELSAVLMLHSASQPQQCVSIALTSQQSDTMVQGQVAASLPARPASRACVLLPCRQHCSTAMHLGPPCWHTQPACLLPCPYLAQLLLRAGPNSATTAGLPACHPDPGWLPAEKLTVQAPDTPSAWPPCTSRLSQSTTCCCCIPAAGCCLLLLPCTAGPWHTHTCLLLRQLQVPALQVSLADSM